MNIVVIINGSGGSGKDTVVNNCANFLKEYNIVVHNYSTVTRIKKIMLKYLGWEATKTEKDRKCMSDLKKVCKQYNNMPFYDVTNRINETKYIHDKKVYFIHSREPEEIQEFIDYFNKDKSIGKVLTLVVTRPNYQILTNESDRRIKEFHYDYVIDNDQTIMSLNYKSKLFSKKLVKEFLKMEMLYDG